MPTGNANLMGSLAPWFGAKRQFAAEIVRQLGPHTAYFEPFCGSMSVLFAKSPCRHEVVNDLHGDITNLAWVLQNRKLKARLLLALNDTFCIEADYNRHRTQLLAEAFRADPAAPDWRRAHRALCVWWMGRSGMAGTRPSRTSFAARFTSRGGSGGVRFRTMVESLPFFARRLRKVDVLNRCGFEILGKVDDRKGTVVYCDPPYVVKNAEYLHDFESADHERLAAAASRFRASRIVISYYPHPQLLELYPTDRWEHIAYDVAKNIKNSTARKDGAQRATEVLIVNRTGSALDVMPTDLRESSGSLFGSME